MDDLGGNTHYFYQIPIKKNLGIPLKSPPNLPFFSSDVFQRRPCFVLFAGATLYRFGSTWNTGNWRKDMSNLSGDVPNSRRGSQGFLEIWLPVCLPSRSLRAPESHDGWKIFVTFPGANCWISRGYFFTFIVDLFDGRLLTLMADSFGVGKVWSGNVMLKSNDLFARFLGLDSFNWKMQLAPLVLVGCKTYFWCMDGKKTPN